MSRYQIVYGEMKIIHIMITSVLKRVSGEKEYGQGDSQSDGRESPKVIDETSEDDKRKVLLKNAFIYIEKFIKGMILVGIKSLFGFNIY